MISFFVPGIPAGKGSFKAFYVKSLGRPVITNDSAKTRPWEQAIRAEARIARCFPVMGPVEVNAVFWLPRPKGHYRPSGGLRASAPLFPTVKPDGDKLLRALLDGLTGEAFADDAQVINASAAKRYCDGAQNRTPGARVSISYIGAVEPAAAKKLCRECRMFCVQDHEGGSCNCDDAACGCVCKAEKGAA